MARTKQTARKVPPITTSTGYVIAPSERILRRDMAQVVLRLAPGENDPVSTRALFVELRGDIPKQEWKEVKPILKRHVAPVVEDPHSFIQ
tara:strand:- start:3405 stop:3674 length:270 start_codon:yes stop_codon:yes gene_type:complete